MGGNVSGKKKHVSYAYSKSKSKYLGRYLKRLMEARNFKEIKTTEPDSSESRTGRPFLTPQEFEFGVYLINKKLRNPSSLKSRVWRPKLLNYALEFAAESNYKNCKQGSGCEIYHPSEQVVQKAFKKLEKLGLIKYEQDRRKGEKYEGSTIGPAITFLPIDLKQSVEEVLSKKS